MDKEPLQVTRYVRKLDSGGLWITVFKDYLFNVDGTSIIKQWNSEGQCIRTMEIPNKEIFKLFVWRDCMYVISYVDNIDVTFIHLYDGHSVREFIEMRSFSEKI